VRTVDNSAAYLAPHLTSATKRCSTSDAGRARSRLTSAGELRPDASRHRCVGGVIDEARRRRRWRSERRVLGRRPLPPSRWTDHTFDRRARAQVLQHSPIPSRAARERVRAQTRRPMSAVIVPGPHPRSSTLGGGCEVRGKVSGRVVDRTPLVRPQYALVVTVRCRSSHTGSKRPGPTIARRKFGG